MLMLALNRITFVQLRGVYRGGVDATCVQFGSRMKEFPPQGGKNSTFKGEEFPHRYMGHT